MWKLVAVLIFASVALQESWAQGGAESLPFHGYVPWDSVIASAPKGDGQVNDIYFHLEKAPVLAEDEIVFYPRNLVGFGIEYGQDPEEPVYRIHNRDEVAKLAQKEKHDKHGKNAHEHHRSKSSEDSARAKDFNQAQRTQSENTPHPQRPSQSSRPSSSSGSYSYPSPPQGAPSFRGPNSSESHSRPSPSQRKPPYPYQASFPPRLPHQN